MSTKSRNKTDFVLFKLFKMGDGSNAADYAFKLILIGDQSTGKSCILHQFIEGCFKKGPAKHTVGVEFGSKTIIISEEKIKLQIWDTAGQERFRSVCQSYYRGATGALIAYDVTNEESFDHLALWIQEVRALAGKEICVVICGNKADLKNERQVDLLEASRFAQENNAMFLETSALTGQNINEVFHMCARAIMTKIQNGEIDSLGLVQNAHQKSLATENDDQSYCSC